MPRRRPGAVRAAQARARHTAVIPGLSPSTCHTLNRLDRDELRPDAVAEALRRWRRSVREPWTTGQAGPSATGPRFRERTEWEWAGLEEPACPACAASRRPEYQPVARDVLSRAIYALPRGKARQLRRLVHHADRQLLDKTLPDPDRPRDVPWWRGRILPR